jgi:hypothetical protein
MMKNNPQIIVCLQKECGSGIKEELSITGHHFTNNMDCTSSPVPTTITIRATTQSDGEFTPVRNGAHQTGNLP